MTPKENLVQLYHSKGFKNAPVGFNLCESLEEEFKKRYPEATSYQDHFNFPYRIIVEPGFSWNFDNLDMLPEQTNYDWSKYYPEEVKKEVKRNLEIAGQKGGLFCCPTHLLGPEVPWENIEAYVEACKEYKNN